MRDLEKVLHRSVQDQGVCAEYHLKNIDKSILIQALDLTPVGTVIIDAVDPCWPVLYGNPVAGQITGFGNGTLIGRPWRSLLVDPCELDTQREWLLDRNVLLVRHLKQRWQSRSGEALSLALQVSPLFLRPEAPASWIVTLNREQGPGESMLDDTLRTVMLDTQKRLRQAESRDSVTGLANRESFLDTIRRDWVSASREKRRLSLIVFEVDALERYRDIFGRQAADSCLRRIAHAIHGCLRRSGDIAARIADHRFAALVGRSDPAGVKEFATTIARRVFDMAIHHPRSPSGRFVSVSFGIASEIPRQGAIDNTLLQTAEAQLDRAGVDDRLQVI